MDQYRSDFRRRMERAKDAAAERRFRSGTAGGGKVYAPKPQNYTAAQLGMDSFDLWLLSVAERVDAIRSEFQRNVVRALDLGTDEIPF